MIKWEMASWESELYNSIQFNEFAAFKKILSRDEVKKNGNLGRQEWVYGTAPLHLAAYFGRDEMIKLLIKAGVNISSYSNAGTEIKATALHYAAYNHFDSTVKLLLEFGANTTLKGNFGKVTGTPLDCAKAGQGCKEIVKLLEDYDKQKLLKSGK